jgi:hypothetical protein
MPDFVKSTGDDNRTTYEHVGQFLAQVSDAGIIDIQRQIIFVITVRHGVQLVHIISAELCEHMGRLRGEIPQVFLQW